MTLIDRLKDRIQSEPWIELQDMTPDEIRPKPPVSAAEIAEAEKQLGFELPPLVRDLYTQVSDGGYGPGYGLVPLAEMVEEGRKIDKNRDYCGWPPKVLHLCWWGCDGNSVLDCSRVARSSSTLRRRRDR